MTVRGPTGGREVTATGLGLYQSCVGKVTSFTIETLGRPGKEFDVVISGPQGNAVPVRCYQHRDGNLLAEFTTNSVGKIREDRNIWNVSEGSEIDLLNCLRHI